MRLARFDAASGLVPVPDAVLPLLTESDPALRDAPFELVRDAVEAQLESACAPLPAGAPVFVPEVFFDPQRCAFSRSAFARPGSAAFLLYDFIPWLHPARIGVTETAPLMPYLALVRDAARTAFISGRTREDYARRILRGRKQAEEAGPILALGADGLALERQDFAPDRGLFVALGSVDGRKNQDRMWRRSVCSGRRVGSISTWPWWAASSRRSIAAFWMRRQPSCRAFGISPTRVMQKCGPCCDRHERRSTPPRLKASAYRRWRACRPVFRLSRCKVCRRCPTCRRMGRSVSPLPIRQPSPKRFGSWPTPP